MHLTLTVANVSEKLFCTYVISYLKKHHEISKHKYTIFKGYWVHIYIKLILTLQLDCQRKMVPMGCQLEDQEQLSIAQFQHMERSYHDHRCI
ncbi:hypothetical protein HanIR_Chr16g0833061 [Helianthus annuus]|nr:hypothetical protein HanIR_Chr16g0833061 [Helianthus annuus]